MKHAGDNEPKVSASFLNIHLIFSFAGDETRLILKMALGKMSDPDSLRSHLHLHLHLHLLPGDILNEILLGLDFSSIMNLCSTNKDYQQLCSEHNSSFWYQYLKMRYPKILIKFSDDLDYFDIVKSLETSRIWVRIQDPVKSFTGHFNTKDYVDGLITGFVTVVKLNPGKHVIMQVVFPDGMYDSTKDFSWFFQIYKGYLYPLDLSYGGRIYRATSGTVTIKQRKPPYWVVTGVTFVDFHNDFFQGVRWIFDFLGYQEKGFGHYGEKYHTYTLKLYDIE